MKCFADHLAKKADAGSGSGSSAVTHWKSLSSAQVLQAVSPRDFAFQFKSLSRIPLQQLHLRCALIQVGLLLLLPAQLTAWPCAIALRRLTAVLVLLQFGVLIEFYFVMTHSLTTRCSTAAWRTSRSCCIWTRLLRCLGQLYTVRWFRVFRSMCFRSVCVCSV